MRISRLLLGATAAIGGMHAAAARVADRLASEPDPYQLEELTADAPGTEGFIVRDDGTRIRTLTAGSGDTIVFAHGYGVSSLGWNLLAERFVRDGGRTITFDQRGHGGSTIGSQGIGSESMAADYAAVLEHYDVQDAVLVAQAMGGFLAVRFLLEHSDLARARIRSVVLVSASAGDEAAGAPWHPLEIGLIERGLLPALARTHVYGTLLAAWAFGRRAPSQLEAFRAEFAATHHAALAPALRMRVDESYYARLGEIDIPVAVVCGTSDRVTAPAHSERLAAGIPDATLTWIDGAGHFLNWEAVDELHALIRAQ